MADEPTTTTAPVTPPPAAPAPNMAELVAAANREAAETAKRIVGEERGKIVQETRQEIADVISGKSKDDNTLNPNFVKLVNNTDETLGMVAEIAEERAYKRLKHEQSQQRAVEQTFGAREDLRTNEVAQMAVAGFVNKILSANPEKDFKEAMTEAVKLYDSKAGVKPELVVAAPQTTTVPSSGGGAGAPAAETKTTEQLDQEELVQMRAEAAAKRRPPGALRVQT